jgi:hypothetical protein
MSQVERAARDLREDDIMGVFMSGSLGDARCASSGR